MALPPVDAITALQGANPTQGPTTRVVGEGSGPDFGSVLTDAIEQAGNLEKRAEHMSDQFAKGDPSVGIHEVMIASEQASIQLRYAVSIKNKILDAYRELMNTQV